MRRTAVLLVFATTVVGAVAQDGKVDERRVAEILSHVEERAAVETDAAYETGDYPRVIQTQRMRYELRPGDGELATDLIWMYGNVDDDTNALRYAIKFRLDNPDDPDRGYPEAELYTRWRTWVKVPRILEQDILRTPPPHRNVYTMLSAAYDRMGFHADVVRVLDVALRNYPDDLVFQRNRSRALEKIGG
jgi:hypothetical protein